MTFDTPILILAWKRPDKVYRIINSIRNIKPQNIYVACDGANKENYIEIKKVENTREIIEKEINWQYHKFEKLYSKKNLGCKLAVSKAIDWFFKNVEEGIIIEDDCLPHQDFFEFAAKMLERYREDNRIWCVSGSNLQNGRINGNSSYYFSYYPLVWGWATWKRCWDKYDLKMNSWPIFKKNKFLYNCFDSKREVRFWEKKFDILYNFNKPDTWDYQWLYCCLKNNGLSIVPNVNLIENIGFGLDATHTTSKTLSPKIINNFQANSSGVLPIRNPENIVRSKNADKYLALNYFSGYPISSHNFYTNLLKRVLNKLKRFIKDNNKI